MKISLLVNTLALVLMVGTCAQTQTAMPPLPAVAEKTGQGNPAQVILKGRAVFEDTGQPAQRERIQLVAVAWLADHRGPHSIPTTITDVNGEFTFRRSPAGEYFVVAHPVDDFAPKGKDGPFPLQTGDPAADATSVEEYKRDFPKITISAQGPAEINLRVRNPHFGIISGRIVDTNAAGAAKAIVHIMKTGEHGFGSMIADENGAYRFRGLEAGQYIVCADPAGKIAGSEVSHSISGVLGCTFFPSTIDMGTSPPVTVSADREVSDINITIAQRSLHSASGTILDEVDGHPIAGAAVRLSKKNEHSSGTDLITDNYFVTTDAQGRWFFNNLLDGSYTIELRSSPILSAKFERFVSRTKNLSVAGMDLENVAIRVSRGVNVSGRVTFEQKDARTEGAVPDVTIHLGSASAPVDPNGEFNVKGVPLNEFPFAVSIRPQNLFYAKSIEVNGTDLLRERLNTTSGAEIKDVRIVIAPASVLTGRVLSASGGTPLSEVSVYLVPVDPSTAPAFARPNGGTNQKGEFVVSGAPGEYYVVMWARNEALPPHDAESIKRNSPNAMTVTLGPGERKSMDLIK